MPDRLREHQQHIEAPQIAYTRVIIGDISEVHYTLDAMYVARSICCLGVMATLVGCATTDYCVKAEFFKPTAAGLKPEVNRYFPYKLDLKPTESASVQVSVCGTREKPALCIETYPDEGVVFQFTQPTLAFRSTADKAVTIPIIKVTYNVNCSGPTFDDARCQSSTKS